MSVIAGRDQLGYVDGSCSAAQFECPNAVICTSDGASIFVSEESRIRCIRPAADQVFTVMSNAGLAPLRGMAFDLSTSIPDSVLYVTCKDGLQRIRLPLG